MSGFALPREQSRKVRIISCGTASSTGEKQVTGRYLHIHGSKVIVLSVTCFLV
jgi:hypothetical protein